VKNNNHLSDETVEILDGIRKYVNTAKHDGFHDKRWPKTVELKLADLGLRRESLEFPLNTGTRTFNFARYCFLMLEYFGVSALRDKYIVWFLEMLQFRNDNDRYSRIAHLLFPKGQRPNSKMAKAEAKAYPRYQSVVKKLNSLGFKKGFNNTLTGVNKLKQAYSKFMSERYYADTDEIKAAINKKQVSILAEMICATEFDLRVSSFPKVRQRSRKKHTPKSS